MPCPSTSIRSRSPFLNDFEAAIPSYLIQTPLPIRHFLTLIFALPSFGSFLVLLWIPTHLNSTAFTIETNKFTMITRTQLEKITDS